MKDFDLIDPKVIVLANLVKNPEFSNKVIPSIVKGVFEDEDLLVVNALKAFISSNNAFPNSSELSVNIAKSLKAIPDGASKTLMVAKVKSLLEEINKVEPSTDLKFLFSLAETFIKERAIFNVILESAELIEKPDPDLSVLPDKFLKALDVNFTTELSLNLWDDPIKKFKKSDASSVKVPFKKKWLNWITQGGAEVETLNLLIASTNVGKSLSLIDLAADYVSMGYNCAYFSSELADFKCLKFLESNLFDIPLPTLNSLNQEEYVKLNEEMHKKMPNSGTFWPVRLPTGVGDVNMARQALKAMKEQTGFVPKVIFFDYIGIMGSISVSPSVGMYLLRKAIAEEMRALFQETGTVGWTAIQMGKEGAKNGSTSMLDAKESSGVADTADFALVLSRTKDLSELKFSHEKSRYNAITNDNKHFVFKVNQHTRSIIEPVELPEEIKKYIEEEKAKIIGSKPVFNSTSKAKGLKV